MAPTATTDCLNWIRAGWDPVRWPSAGWPVAPKRPAGWVPASMPCEWPAVQRPMRRWGLRYPYLGPSPWPGMGVVVVV